MKLIKKELEDECTSYTHAYSETFFSRFFVTIFLQAMRLISRRSAENIEKIISNLSKEGKKLFVVFEFFFLLLF